MTNPISTCFLELWSTNQLEATQCKLLSMLEDNNPVIRKCDNCNKPRCEMMTHECNNRRTDKQHTQDMTDHLEGHIIERKAEEEVLAQWISNPEEQISYIEFLSEPQQPERWVTLRPN
jgi:hypothetical protein